MRRGRTPALYARTANSKTGKFTKGFDKAPSPFKRTRSLYNGKAKYQVAMLCQLRTGICRLNRYFSVIGAASSTQCKCEKGVETVGHFLLRCPLWSEFRQKIRQLAGPRWGNTSYPIRRLAWAFKKTDPLKSGNQTQK